MVEDQDEKKICTLNNSVVMDDGTDPERIETIQRGIEQSSLQHRLVCCSKIKIAYL